MNPSRFLLAGSLVFLCCAHIPEKKEMVSAEVFGEIKLSSREGFFNGKISLITDGRRIRIEIFSPFGNSEFLSVYNGGGCLFLFPKEKRVLMAKDGCHKIEIGGEFIIPEELINFLLKKSGQIEGMKVEDYRIFEGISYPHSIRLDREEWSMKIKVEELKVNRDVERFFKIEIPEGFHVEVMTR